MRDVIEIQTERLKLRALCMKDAPSIARYAGDEGVARMISHAPTPYLTCAAEGWIMTLRARAPLAEDFVFALDLEGEGLIGVIGAHKRRAGDGFEIGYWIGRPFWGRGYATEGLRGLLAEARSLGPLHAGHFADNPASGRVLQKGGFAYTGETEQTFSIGRGARGLVKRMRFTPERRDVGLGVRAAAAVH